MASRYDCFCSSIQSRVSWAAILFRACQRGPVGSVTPVFPGASLEPEVPKAIQIIIRFESRSKLYKQYFTTNKHLLLMRLNYSCELACHSSGSINTRSYICFCRSERSTLSSGSEIHLLVQLLQLHQGGLQ